MLDAWQGFFQASAAASATLAGLLVVAISIDLSRILAFPSLPDRAAASLVSLGGVMALSLLVLVPGQPPRLFGFEMLASAAAIWLGSLVLLLRSSRGMERVDRVRAIQHLAVNQAQTAPLVIGGTLLAIGAGGGLYWMVPGVIAVLVAGILNAWVLLIEILR